MVDVSLLVTFFRFLKLHISSCGLSRVIPGMTGSDFTYVQV